ncbi:hypothetical protein J4Q44_G00371610 [Coregonus suidteri]|uniref:Uncharacterized protein n=1 Tax=Coregonus suidteri TaxID=861788 RepID=A0AAN8KHI3_9TELE
MSKHQLPFIQHYDSITLLFEYFRLELDGGPAMLPLNPTTRQRGSLFRLLLMATTA